MLQIPTDVCYTIIDTVSLLQDEDDCRLPGNDRYVTDSNPVDEWRTVLTSCALVSHAWYLRTKFHLERHVSLTSSKQVRILSARLRSQVGSREMARQVTIFGLSPKRAAQQASRGSAPHLSAFAATLPGLLPRLERLTLAHIRWRVGLVQPKHLALLAAFRIVTCLDLRSIEFQSVSQFAHVLGALPSVRMFVCCDVVCLREEELQSSLNAVRCAGLREVVIASTDFPIAAFFADLEAIPAVECLTITFDISDVTEGKDWPFQRLLEAYHSSLCELRLIVTHDTYVDAGE